jgi:hypothetical protein
MSPNDLTWPRDGEGVPGDLLPELSSEVEGECPGAERAGGRACPKRGHTVRVWQGQEEEATAHGSQASQGFCLSRQA